MTARRVRHRSRVAAALLGVSAAGALLAAAAARAAPDWARDPVHVYYDGGDCEGSEIALEVWSRTDGAWIAHPAHPRVPVPSCQIEDAGWLFNELRWRCSTPEAPWRIFRVFDPSVMERCAVGGTASAAGETAIVVESPGEGVPVQAEEPFVNLVGSVRVGGVEGSDYDVVLAIDRGAPPEALAAQVAAARDFAARVGPQLGAVKIAVMSSLPASQAGRARRELSFSADPKLIDKVLTRVASQPCAPAASPGTLLDASLDELARGREGARPLILFGMGGAQLGGDRALDPADPLRQALARASHVELHWRALGGVASEAPSWLKSAVGEGSFERIPVGRFESSFWSEVALPVAKSVRIERAGSQVVEAALDPRGGFRARLPVVTGSNRLRIEAHTSDGKSVERPYEVVFDDALVLEKILEAERARIRAAQRKRLELRPESGDEP